MIDRAQPDPSEGDGSPPGDPRGLQPARPRSEETVAVPARKASRLAPIDALRHE